MRKIPEGGLAKEGSTNVKTRAGISKLAEDLVQVFDPSSIKSGSIHRTTTVSTEGQQLL